MAVRGRPRKLPPEDQRVAIRLTRRSKDLASRLALALGEVSRRDLRDLERLPAGLRQIVESARGKHRRYQPALARKEAAFSPKRGEAWRLQQNDPDWWKQQGWREQVLGNKESALPYLRQKNLLAPIASPRAPPYVGGVFGRIEKEIGKMYGVHPRTLRLWLDQDPLKDMLTPRRRPKAVRDPKA